MKGLICTVIPYRNKPTIPCPRCLIHYCYEHMKSHGHKVSSQDIQKEKERDTDKTR